MLPFWDFIGFQTGQQAEQRPTPLKIFWSHGDGDSKNYSHP